MTAAALENAVPNEVPQMLLNNQMYLQLAATDLTSSAINSHFAGLPSHLPSKDYWLSCVITENGNQTEYRYALVLYNGIDTDMVSLLYLQSMFSFK